MQCKSCGYALWQLRDRTCPECGTSFKPSEYEFLCNSVRFCCPHCQQAYYGTGPNGHLEPIAFECVNCNAHIEMDDMVLLPSQGLSSEQTELPRTPWAERRGRSWFKAFFKTFSSAVSNPTATIEGVPPESSLRRAAGYAAIHLTLQAVFGAWFLPFMMFGFMAAAMGGGVGGVLGIFGAVLVTCFVLAVSVALWIVLAHLLLRMTGSTANGITRTAHALLYSSGNNFLSAVPCLSLYVGWVGGLWWTISAGFMLAKAQRVSGGRAGLAVALPPVLALGLLFGGVAVLFYVGSNRLTTTFSTISVARSSRASATQLAGLLPAQGTLPPHAAQLIIDGVVPANGFLLPPSESMSTTQSTHVAGRTLEWFEFPDRDPDLPAPDPSGLLAFSGAAPPAHRVGDFVFTYQGIPADETRLWIAIAWPDPSANFPSQSKALARPVQVIDGTRTVLAIPDDAFDTVLAEQNALRATFNLLPLPHPKDVRSLPDPAGESPPTPSNDLSEPTAPLPTEPSRLPPASPSAPDGSLTNDP